MLFQHMKELYTWRLEQGQEISALRKCLDKDNDIIVDNRQSIAQTSQDLGTLSGSVRIVARQQEYLQERQDEDHLNHQNVDYGHHMKLAEVEEKFSNQVEILRKSQQDLCAGFIEARREMSNAIKVARQECKERLRMERELEELKEDCHRAHFQLHFFTFIFFTQDDFPTLAYFLDFTKIRIL